MSPVAQNKQQAKGDNGELTAASWLQRQGAKPKGPPAVQQSTSPVKSTRRAPSQAVHGSTTNSQMEVLFRAREKLYEAYNDLHALAQVFSKPFDAPAILVVGHQTDGKSGAHALLTR